MGMGMNAIVTGANGGIGRAVLKKFAEKGIRIWACARTEAEEFVQFCQELEREYQVMITNVYFDLMEEDEIQEGIKRILSEKQPVDILVNNAGMAYGALLQMTSMRKLKEVYQVNYFAQVQITQMVARHMMKHKKGSIINVASVGGIEADPGYLAYGSSKASLIWTTRMLANELGAYGIRVNAVAPGTTDTRMGRYKSQEELDKVLARTSLGRMADPEEIAAGIYFLASDEAAYITGDILKIDGGRTA